MPLDRGAQVSRGEPETFITYYRITRKSPPPTAARCLCTSFPSQRCAQRTVTAAKADVQRHSPGAARSAPPGHVLQSAHSAVPRLGSARGPHRRTAQPAIPARFPPGPVPLPSRSPRRAQVRRSRPGPAAHRRPRGCASSARLAPAAAEPRARFPQPPLPGRPRAPQPIGAASGGARLGLGPAARGGAAWRLRAEPRTALSDGLGAAPGRIASRPEPRGQHPSRGSAATFARTLGRNSDTSNRRSGPNVARKTAALLTRQFLITEENKALERFTGKKMHDV